MYFQFILFISKKNILVENGQNFQARAGAVKHNDQKSKELVGFSDSDHGGDAMDYKSIGGMVF